MGGLLISASRASREMGHRSPVYVQICSVPSYIIYSFSLLSLLLWLLKIAVVNWCPAKVEVNSYSLHSFILS